jgi:hypothetical protein
MFQGVSESWWGMYEVIAPPVFLLTNKLDPIFAQSKAYLVTIGVPQTETDQFIYNQVGSRWGVLLKLVKQFKSGYVRRLEGLVFRIFFFVETDIFTI